MSGSSSAVQAVPPLDEGLELLDRAVAWTRLCLQRVTPARLRSATPCSRWDLGELLTHMDDSLCALQSAADVGHVTLTSTEPDDAAHPVLGVKRRACALLGAWAANDGAELVSIAGSPLAARTLVTAGALEITVHGWDVARACGCELPIPAALADALLPLVPQLVSEVDRGTRFGPVVAVPPWAASGDRLVAALGRDPWCSPTRHPQSPVWSRFER